MPALFLDETENESPEAHWVPVTIEPWNGDLRLKLRPATRALLDVIEERAKRNPLWNLHKVTVDGKVITRNGNEGLARQVEHVKAVVEDWDGVEGDLPCTDENKTRVALGHLRLVVFIMETAVKMAGVKTAAEEGN